MICFWSLIINLNYGFKGKLTEIATLVRLKNSELSEDSKGNSGCIPQVAEEIKHVSVKYNNFFLYKNILFIIYNCIL